MPDPPVPEPLRSILDAERELMPHDVYAVGSMLSYDERLLLHWAARTGPPGAVMDLGSFLGGSTLALASGSEQRGETVHAYDRFRLEADWERTWIPDGFALEPGDSTRDVLAHNIRRVGERVVVHEGDIRDATWDDPIGVLFVDVAKTWTTADAIWSTFLTRLVAGALVIQQDQVHWGHPWCAIAMEALADDFEYVGWVWYSSAVYRCRRPVREVPVPMLERFTCDEMLELLERNAARIGEPAAASIRLSGTVVLAWFGRFDEARERIAEAARNDDEDALPFLDEGVAHLTTWLAATEAQRTP